MVEIHGTVTVQLVAPSKCQFPHRRIYMAHAVFLSRNAWRGSSGGTSLRTFVDGKRRRYGRGIRKHRSQSSQYAEKHARCSFGFATRLTYDQLCKRRVVPLEAVPRLLPNAQANH